MKVETVEQTKDSSSYGLPVSDLDEEEQEYLSASGILKLNRGTQTEYSKYTCCQQKLLLRNEVTIAGKTSDGINIVPSLSYETISKNSLSMKHFTGMDSDQFEAL